MEYWKRFRNYYFITPLVHCVPNSASLPLHLCREAVLKMPHLSAAPRSRCRSHQVRRPSPRIRQDCADL